MKVQVEAIRRAKELLSPLTTHSRGRVGRLELRRIALTAIGVVSVGMLGSASIPAHAFGDRVHHAAAGTPHPVRATSQRAKRDILAYVNDRQCGKSGAINGVEKFLEDQKQNLETAKEVSSGVKRASAPLEDALSQTAKGVSNAAALAKKYPSAVVPVVRAIRNFHKALTQYRRDQDKAAYIFAAKLAFPLANEVVVGYQCARGIIGWNVEAGEAVAAPETEGGTAAAAVAETPKNGLRVALGCSKTIAGVAKLPQDIASAKKFLALVRKIEEDHRKVTEQHQVAESTIEAAGKKIPPAGQRQLANLRATMKAAARDADRAHEIMQSSVKPELREALHRDTLHLQSGLTTVATCAKKLRALSKHLERDLAAGL